MYVGLGLPASRGDQLFANLFRPGLHDIARMTDIGKAVRGVLAEHATISRLIPEVVETVRRRHQKIRLPAA